MLRVLEVGACKSVGVVSVTFVDRIWFKCAIEMKFHTYRVGRGGSHNYSKSYML